MVLDDHLVDQQPSISLAEGRIVGPEAIAKELAESAKHVRCNPALGRCQLPFERRDVSAESGNALPMMGQSLGEISNAR